MTNNLTGLTALIGSIAALVTAIGTLILHLRSRNAQSKKAAQLPPPASQIHVSAENTPPGSQS